MSVAKSMRNPVRKALAGFASALTPGLLAGSVQAAEFGSSSSAFPQWTALLALAIFMLGLGIAIGEEFFGLRKSKPVLLAGGLIWALIAWTNQHYGLGLDAEGAARGALVNYLELMLFLLVIMAYVNAMTERQVFAALRAGVGRRGYGWKKLFWVIGGLTFLLSPLLDNLSTAIVMGSVVISLGRGNPAFTALGCINVVVAANAGGSFSPVGDLTTLLLWQQGIVTPQGSLDFSTFFLLFLPALVSWLVPAAIMHCKLPGEGSAAVPEAVPVRRGGLMVVALFLASIATCVLFEILLQLPPALGMMTGLAYLQFFGYYLKRTHRSETAPNGLGMEKLGGPVPLERGSPFDVFQPIARAEWDTLLFICGIFLGIGGLWYLGWLAATEAATYAQWGPLAGNMVAGLISAFVENLPTMIGIIAMDPDLSLGYWLLAALTVATGGSLLAVGSAGGVALMGLSRGLYSFLAHLKWTPAIALGYLAGIGVHLWVNAGVM